MSTQCLTFGAGTLLRPPRKWKLTVRYAPVLERLQRRLEIVIVAVQQNREKL